MAGTGGARKGAGRKPKASEQKIAEALSPLFPSAFKALQNAIKDEEGWAVKMYFEYLYGKPRQQVDVTTGGDKINMPIVSWIDEPEQEI